MPVDSPIYSGYVQWNSRRSVEVQRVGATSSVRGSDWRQRQQLHPYALACTSNKGTLTLSTGIAKLVLLSPLLVTVASEGVAGPRLLSTYRLWCSIKTHNTIQWLFIWFIHITLHIIQSGI